MGVGSKMTDQNDAAKAVYNEFIDKWGDKTPAAFDNEAITYKNVVLESTPDTPWIRLVIRLTTGGQETLGAKTKRKFKRNGIIMAQVFVPEGTGTFEANELSKQLADIFEGNSINGVVCKDAIPRPVGVRGKWYQTNVDIDIEYYETK